MAEEWNRDELLKRMRVGRVELERLVALVPVEERTQPILANGWSVKDLLGHLGFWENRAVELYRFITGGPEPEPKPGSISTDELNVQVFAANQVLDFDIVTAEEQVAFQAIWQVSSTAPEEDLFDPKRFAWTEGQPFAAWIVGNAFGHYEEHIPDLRGYLRLPGEIAYAVDGRVVHGYSAHAGSDRPGVIVLHAWWGLNPFFRQLCDRLAAAGFTVFAPDMNEGKIALTVQEAEKLMEARDFGRMQAVAMNAVEQLRHQPGVKPGPVGVIGFSMGAAWASVLSWTQPEEIGAAVLFYGGEHLDFSKARAAYQGHFAQVDEWEPDEGIRQLEAEMKEAGREVTFYRYPATGHWFFEEDRPDAYEPQAAALAWDRTLAFLREHLGS